MEERMSPTESFVINPQFRSMGSQSALQAYNPTDTNIQSRDDPEKTHSEDRYKVAKKAT